MSYVFEEIVWVLEYFKREILDGLLCINVGGYMSSLDIVFEGSVCNKIFPFFYLFFPLFNSILCLLDFIYF